MTGLDSLWPAAWPTPPEWRGAPLAGPAAAFAAALAWAGLLRLLNRRDLAALGTALGLAVAWTLTLGVPLAPPRHFADRLPLLALAGLGAALLLLLLVARWPRGLALGAGLALMAGAWWLVGAPTQPADLRRALVPLLALTVAAAVAWLELRSPLRAVAAFALLLAGLWLAQGPAPGGPWAVLAAAASAAAVGALPAGGPWPAAAAVPVALALAGLAAGPVLARGAAPDWTTAAAPFAALLLGPALAARLGGRAGPTAGWAVAGGFPLLLTWLLARNP